MPYIRLDLKQNNNNKNPEASNFHINYSDKTVHNTLQTRMKNKKKKLK